MGDTTVGLILEVVDTSVDTTLSTGVSVITDSHSKTSTEQHTGPVRELTRQEGDGVTLLGMAALMPGSHRGSLTIPGHIRLVSSRDRHHIVIVYRVSRRKIYLIEKLMSV